MVEPVEDIEFADPGRLVDGELELRLVGTTPADHERGFDPACQFEMIGVRDVVMGNINLRVGHTQHEIRRMPPDYPYAAYYPLGSRTKRRYRWLPAIDAS